MQNEIYLLVAVAVVGIGYVIREVFEYRKYGGKMLVTCPETGRPAAVRVDTWRAILAALIGRRRVELCECSRWPERQDCPQDCLCEIQANPEAHRVWSVASHWYEGKNCAFCGKVIEPVKHLDRRPALLNLEQKTFEWDDIPAQDLPDALGTCQPVCWSCHIAQTFVREHPDLVTYRPGKRSGPLGEYTPEKRDDRPAAPPRAA